MTDLPLLALTWAAAPLKDRAITSTRTEKLEHDRKYILILLPKKLIGLNFEDRLPLTDEFAFETDF